MNARRVTLALSLIVTLLLVPLAAEAVGPLVGTECTGADVAPTTHSDGTPITEPLTYNYYVVAGTPAAPPSPLPAPKAVASGLTVPGLCAGLTGQQTAYSSAIGNSIESVLSAAFPFMVMTPSQPINFVITGCNATWGPVTIYTDFSAISGPVSYDLLTAPSTATQPPATATVSGITTTSVNVCTGLAPGSYKAWIRSRTTPTPGGSVSLSIVSASAPFSSVAPNPPTVSVK